MSRNGQRALELDQVQRWMQAVITHPDGVAEGIRSDSAQQEIGIQPEQVEDVVLRSQNLTSIERLHIYASAYYARLLECLREEFPALVHALGEEMFDGFAFGYLQSFPSTSYTLADLAGQFPDYLAQTRPVSQEDTPDWADFLIDLATVERAYSEVFDGPGVEGQTLLDEQAVASIPPDQWPQARLVPVPCLRLLSLRFPVHEYISAVRRDQPVEMPPAAQTWLVITRRDYIVRRVAVSQLEFELLADLANGTHIGQAIEALADRPECDWDTLAAQLHGWFHHWAAAGFFQRVALDSREVS